MLPVLDRPMLDWAVERLVAAGVTDVVLSLGYRPDAFRGAYPYGRCCGAKLHYAVEPEPLDTAGAIRFAAIEAGLDRGSEPFLVINGDVITEADPTALLELHRRSGAEATILLTPVDDPSRYGVVPIRPDGQVEAFVEKPPLGSAPSNWINAGTYVLQPSVLAHIPAGRKVSIERDTFPALVATGTVYASQSDAYWIDAGTPESFLAVQLHLLRSSATYVGPGARVSADAVVEQSVVMAGARVGSGAVLRRSVLLPGAVLEAGAVVEDSILGCDATVGEGARLSDHSVIGDGIVVAAGSVLVEARLPGGQPE